MRRTALLYGTALSTLVAAFLLSPSDKAPPAPEPPPPEPPPQASLDPITHLSYANGMVQVDARVDRGLLLTHAGVLASEPVYLDVTVKALGEAQRAPLAAVLVIDRSGSMAGEKIDAARMSAERFVNRLSDGDRLAIVSYGTDVSVDMPLTPLDAVARTEARRTIARLEEGGGTNIDGGLAAAERLLERASLSGFVGRVVLISDGRATEGERRTDRLSRHGEKLRKMGMTLSTLGVGLDYHEDLMEQLATLGGGRYHYLKQAHELGPILDDELKHAAAVVARGVELHLPKDLGALSVQGAPGHTLRDVGSRVAVLVGDLAAGEERNVLIRLDVSPGAAVTAQGVRFAAPELLYVPVGKSTQELLAHRADTFRLLSSDQGFLVEQSRRDDVRARVLTVTASVELTESMRAYARGDVREAVRRIEQNRQKLAEVAAATKNAALVEEAQNLGKVLQQVKSEAPSSADAQDLVKFQKARAYKLRR